jgi:sec-independent protein translocase protein TatA
MLNSQFPIPIVNYHPMGAHATYSSGICDSVACEGDRMGQLGVPELIIIAVIALIIFGPKKLPDLGAGLGKAIRDFKGAIRSEPEQPAKEEKKEEKEEARK